MTDWGRDIQEMLRFFEGAVRAGHGQPGAAKSRRLARKAGKLARRAGLERDVQQAIGLSFDSWVIFGELVTEENMSWIRREFLAAASDGPASPAGIAARLVSVAARIVPVGERERYLEEFQAELIEVGRGWRQCVHGLRVLVRAVPLRCELRRPARERVR